MSLAGVPDRRAKAALADAARRDAIGSMVAAVTDFGITLTAAISSVGHGAVCSNSDIIVLGTVRRDGPQRPNVLSELTGLTTGGTTNLLDRLDGAGFVTRTSEGVQDGRGVLVELTKSGRRTIEQIAEVVSTEVATDPGRFAAVHRWFAGFELDIPVMPSSLTDPVVQIGDVLRWATFGNRVMAILRQALDDDPTPSKSTLTMWYGSRPQGVRPGELTELTGLSSAGVSELLERMEERDLIERAAGRPPDRRVVTVTTTETGREALSKALDALDAHLDELHAEMVRR